MNGIHDLGGMHGFGSVDPADDTPFHEEWEQQFFALGRALSVSIPPTLDEKRYQREQLHPTAYLTAGYWEQRLIASEQLLLKHGLLEPNEVDERMGKLDQVESANEESDPELAAKVKTSFSSNSTFDREPKDPRFGVGDTVMARNSHPEGHTRLPRYVRRAQGAVTDFHGTQMLPDAAADGNTDVGEPLYSVRFTATELWGAEESNPDSVTLQLFESYLREPTP